MAVCVFGGSTSQWMLCLGARETDPAGHSARQHDGAVGAEMGTPPTQYALSLIYTV